MANAVRRALNIFDAWNDVTGVVPEHTSYYYELQAVIEDAVHCGAQAALGIKQRLDSEEPASNVGRAGGLARAAKLTPERRSEIARKAANHRWRRDVDGGQVKSPGTVRTEQT